ncbi:AAA family ATPase [Bernardetia sp. Wsw4-3y2]|uniref:AAA family ATPase n=1 Tax=Bernardetia sp. Wsw4-3y2 TaxID=3127471 RepID=UPI0030D0828F
MIKQLVRNEVLRRLEQGVSGEQLRKEISVSSAYISNIRKGEMDHISDSKIREMAKALNISLSDWFVVKTKSYKSIFAVCEEAQNHKRLLAIVGGTGQGKTTALRKYKSENEVNCFYVHCNVLMNKNDFLTEILRSMREDTKGKAIEKLQRICSVLIKTKDACLILDDFGKVKDSILQILQLIYDEIEGRAGIVIAGTEYLKTYIDKMCSKDKLGFREMNRRIGLWKELTKLSSKEAKIIAKGRGISEPNAINYIIRVCQNLGTLKELLTNAERLANGNEVTFDVLKLVNEGV